MATPSTSTNAPTATATGAQSTPSCCTRALPAASGLASSAIVVSSGAASGVSSPSMASPAPCVPATLPVPPVTAASTPPVAPPAAPLPPVAPETALPPVVAPFALPPFWGCWSAAMARVSTCVPSCAQTRCSLPSTPTAAFLTTVHAPQLWALGSMAISCSPATLQRVQ